MRRNMRVAVVGGGVSGMMSAYALAKEGVEVVLYEKEDRIGGHANTVTVDDTQMDIGFMVFNRVTYPNMMELFESLGVDMEPSDMSFSVSLADGQGCEWGTRNGFSSLFAQKKKNILNPNFWKMIREITKFNDDAINYVEELENNRDIDRYETLEHFVQSRGYSDLFLKAFLIPSCASIWSCPSEIMRLSAYSVLSFLRNHHALQLFGRPQWLTLRHRSQDYVNKVKKELELRGCQIRTSSEVQSVLTNDEGCAITCKDGLQEVYDACIIAAHAPDALRMLGKQATFDESRILGAFKYAYSDIYLHHDNNLMPKNRAAWSAWNFLGTNNNKVYITYWLNAVQNINEKGLPFLSTLNPPYKPEHTLLKCTTSHPVPSVAAAKASAELNLIQGKRRIWFCGAYQGALKPLITFSAGIHAANSLLGKGFTVHKNPKHMIPSWPEAGARLLVTRFLQRFIATGCLILLEEGGTILTFEGIPKRSILKVSLNVHTPQFYWKIATEGDLGLADAYINGDFSFVDKNEGLVSLIMLFIANTELNTCTSKLNKKRGWWTPLLFTSVLSSAKYFFRHVSRRNTLTQARQNISRHYDLSNELFSLFLDETMAYSCALFQTPDEDLKNAQLRKIRMLIEKARINKEHHVLEIGCGWGSLALEVVKRTGCKYTGITLSEKQLQYAEMKAKEAGLQDNVTFLLCDYRQLPEAYKYDRIISCEMLEAVGHEYMEEFFKCCESVLAENGLFVLQFTSIADEKYDEFRLSQGFMKEYIFPGGCLPSLSRVTSAMAAASRLSVVHLEDIGSHYYQTLRCWRENFLKNQSKIVALGFDEKFIRTWEYYFDYCAAGFKSRILGNYQIVFNRPGDLAASGQDPYTGSF
ncbi:hypothetical protein DH2020_027499 [Rehmannia glutinosa]|uniref:Amine oxidase domain-containing protein n=1 Tax=Rehmannia glutinosa TaxID=99300 RepID=A0ABR0VXV0_REHGL